MTTGPAATVAVPALPSGAGVRTHRRFPWIGSQRQTVRMRPGAIPRGYVPVAIARAAAVALLAPVALLAGAGSALAEAPAEPAAGMQAGIVVEPDHVEAGARDITLVFRMTDIDPAAPAVGLRLLLPTGRPLIGVTPSAPPGWTAEVTTTALPTPAPSADGPVREIATAVAWTATEPRAAGPMEFALHVDLMPEGAGPVRIRAACTDTAGRTFEWADSWAEGGPKPMHDALKLALGPPSRPAAAVDHGDHHGEGTLAAQQRGAVTPAGVAMTLGALLTATAALTALMVMLSRRQRDRWETHTYPPRDHVRG